MRLLFILLFCVGCATSRVPELTPAQAVEKDRRVTFVLVGWGLMFMIITWDTHTEDNETILRSLQ